MTFKEVQDTCKDFIKFLDSKGIDWRSEQEFGKVMVYLTKIGLLLQDGFTVKRNPHSIFSEGS